MRRPVSRQVTGQDPSGVSVQKMLAQQQMRNTQFDGQSGFGAAAFQQKKFKGTAALVQAAITGAAFEQLNLDSDRNIISRKRGGKLATATRPQAPPCEGDVHLSIRDSQ